MKLNDEEKRKKAFEKRLEYQKNAKERAIKKYKEKIQKILPVWFYGYANFSTKRLGRRHHSQCVWA